MLLSLPPGVPAIRCRTYPHLMPLDAALWDAWLDLCDYDIDAVWYDLKVGSLPPGTDLSTPARQAIAEGTLLKRIDVVAQIDGQLWVIECKPYANHVPLGQVLAYAALLPLRYALALPLRPVVIAAARDPDLIGLYRHHGVHVELVPQARI